FRPRPRSGDHRRAETRFLRLLSLRRRQGAVRQALRFSGNAEQAALSSKGRLEEVRRDRRSSAVLRYLGEQARRIALRNRRRRDQGKFRRHSERTWFHLEG